MEAILSNDTCFYYINGGDGIMTAQSIPMRNYLLKGSTAADLTHLQTILGGFRLRHPGSARNENKFISTIITIYCLDMSRTFWCSDAQCIST